MAAKPKSDYWCSPEGLILLEGWARDGLSQEQIAHNMGISLTTLKTYIKDPNLPISTAIKKGKEVVIYAVENALYKQALDGNITAQIFILTNTANTKWRRNADSVMPPHEKIEVILTRNKK